MVMSMPKTVASRVGKMRKKLNTTSIIHITTLARPGTVMFPLLRNSAVARKVRPMSGTPAAKMPKYHDAGPAMSLLPPSHPGRTGAIATPKAAMTRQTRKTVEIAERVTLRAPSSSPAPTRWAT